MCRIVNSILAVTAAGSIVGFAAAQSPSIEGVWQTVEVRTTGPGARTITRLQPSLAIITAKHYSRLEIHAEGPRPTALDPGKATAEELRQLWGPVVAEAGKYEVNANTLTMRPLVSKNPALMAADVAFTYDYRLAGDTLWVTMRRGPKGAIEHPPTIKLLRVE